MKRSCPVQNIPRSLQRNNAGYSLLELLVVLFCLSALLGIAMPAYRQTVDYWHLKSAADQLAAHLKECQSQAVLSGIPQSLHIAGETQYEIRSGAGVKLKVKLPKGIRLSGNLALNRNFIEFNGKGHPAGGGSLVLENSHGKKFRITVQLHTGQIQLKEGTDEQDS
ncbi:prepilin-type N-terminal cleavage/methylation domain-containing protein [Effusibacillus lacus]|nr:prepilin-type N-terminal cleavage/methylation domain-containing protein [Effusibacillus lacus]